MDYTRGSWSWCSKRLVWWKILQKKYPFFPETPQTALEPVRGLENLTPRGHNTNKTKIEICFWKIWFFRKFFDQHKKLFFEKSQKFTKSEKIENLDFVNFEIFRKHSFCFGRKFFEKIKMFKNKFHFSFCLYYVLAVTNFQVRGPVLKRSAVSPEKKGTFFVKFSILEGSASWSPCVGSISHQNDQN